MNKRVLAIYYSQSGQLGEIIDHFTAPLITEGITVEKIRINLVNNYAFPWTTDTFFSVMPDSVLDRPAELVPFELKESKYDLIILGYQAWFLSLSIPINSLLRDQSMKTILNESPVITITGARNMWLNAFVRVKKLLRSANAKLVGNIALIDRHANPISFITIFHWMLHGKKDRYLNIFPPAGVSEADINHTSVFGTCILPYLKNNSWNELQAALDLEKAVEPNYNLMVIESLAGKIFIFWANFITHRKNKKLWLKVFKYYLLFAFFIGAPILIIIDAILFRFFAPRHIKAKMEFFLALN